MSNILSCIYYIEMSSAIISTRSFHEVKKNGKVVDKKMLDATYDGNKAIIDNFYNDRAYRYELSRDDIEGILKKMSIGNSDSVSLKAPSKISSTPTVVSTSVSRKKKAKNPKREKREKRMRSAGRSRTRARHGKYGKHGKHATRGRNKK